MSALGEVSVTQTAAAERFADLHFRSRKYFNLYHKYHHFSTAGDVIYYSAAAAIDAGCTPRTSLPGFAPVDTPSQNVSVPATNVWR